MQPVDKPLTIYRKKGCQRCNMTGFTGRSGVFEILEVTHEVARVIETGGNADKIKEVAVAAGMETLRVSATHFVLDGRTTVEEMRKVSFDS